MLEVTPSIRHAMASGLPAVALETAVLTHGLPNPFNLQVMFEMIAGVREVGAHPAVIALQDGAARVGLDDAAIERLATTDASKVSLRDIAPLLAAGGSGGTTVAATLAIAHAAGIEVFATGGIGGVHRGDAGDVSADLDALARYPLIVVCSGPKSLLDLPRTVEALESRGVTIILWNTDVMPAFYATSSGIRLPHRVETPSDVASIASAHAAIGLKHAILVTVPPPRQHALEIDEVESLSDRAHAAAREAGVNGAALTPFVLERMSALSEGRTLAANRALLVENARIAASIAMAL